MARGENLWFNGEIRKVEDTKISLFTHGLHYGVGVFEGIRAYEQDDGSGGVFRLNEHMDRFCDSLKILGLDCPFSSKDLSKAALEVTRSNSMKECYIRPIAYVADGPLGIDLGEKPPIDVAILNWEWGKYLGQEGVKNGIRMKISSFNRPHPNSIMTKGKITGQYVTGVLGKREAKLDGYDEALFLDPDGYLAEGSGENLFIATRGVVKTTPLTSVLQGITRETVIQLLKADGLEVQETRFTRDELWCADEVFLTGTAAEVTPVREIDNRTIGRGSNAGKPGPITKKMQTIYNDLVRGKLPEFSRTQGIGENWITKI